MVLPLLSPSEAEIEARRRAARERLRLIERQGEMQNAQALAQAGVQRQTLPPDTTALGTETDIFTHPAATPPLSALQRTAYQTPPPPPPPEAAGLAGLAQTLREIGMTPEAFRAIYAQRANIAAPTEFAPAPTGPTERGVTSVGGFFRALPGAAGVLLAAPQFEPLVPEAAIEERLPGFVPERARGAIAGGLSTLTAPVNVALAPVAPGVTAGFALTEASLGALQPELARLPAPVRTAIEIIAPIVGSAGTEGLLRTAGRRLAAGATEAEVAADVRAAGEAVPTTMYHGTAGPIEGPLREGTFLTPSREDARVYADVTARLTGKEPRVVPVQVQPGAATPVEEGLAASRGAVRVTRPEGVRPIEEAPVLPREGLPARAAGGEALTAERVAARQEPAQALREAIPQSGAREGREVWRAFYGAEQAGAVERRAWAGQVYREGRTAGIKVVPADPRQTDQVVEIMERAFMPQRAPVATYRPTEQAFVQRLYDRLDETTAKLIAADPDFEPHALPEYFPHLFKKIKAGTRRVLPSGRGFQLRPGFLLKRKLTGPLADILEEHPNLDLVSWDPVDFVVRHEAAVDNYVASLEAIRAGKASGMIVPAKGAPEGWVTPNVPPFRIRQRLQNWAVEPKFAETLQQMFGESAFDQHGALRLLKRARTTGFAIKVFGALFQQIDYAWRSLGLSVSELARGHPVQAAKAVAAWPRAVARGLSPGLDQALVEGAAKNPKLMAGYKAGLAAGIDPSVAETALRGLGPEFLNVPGVQQLLSFLTGRFYGKFHTEMLEQAYLVNLEKELRGGAELQAAARKAVEETNVYFSSIPAWQSVWKSPTSRDLMRFASFAIGELEGWFRIPVQAPAGFGGILAATYGAAEMLNRAFTGHWMTPDQLVPYRFDPKKPTVSKTLRGDVPFVTYNTGYLRPELPWTGPNGRKLYMDLLGQADTPFRFALDPLFAVQTRLGQLPRTVVDVGTAVVGGVPAFGEPVRRPSDLAKLLAQEVSPIAIGGLAGTEKGRIGFLGAGIQASGLNLSSEGLRDLRNRVMVEESGGQYDYDHAPRDEQRRFDQAHIDLTDERIQAIARWAASGDPVGQFREETIRVTGEAEKGYEGNRGLIDVAARLHSGDLNPSGYAAARSEILTARAQQIAGAQRRLALTDEQLKPQTDDPFYLNALADRIAAIPYPGAGATDQEVQAYRDAKEAMLAPLTPEERHAVLVDFPVSRWQDPVLRETERQFLEARYQVDEFHWFDLQARMLRAVGLPAAPSEVRRRVGEALKSAGQSPDERSINAAVDKIVASATAVQKFGVPYDQLTQAQKKEIVTPTKLRRSIRIANPELDAELWLAGYVDKVETAEAAAIVERRFGKMAPRTKRSLIEEQRAQEE